MVLSGICQILACCDRNTQSALLCDSCCLICIDRQHVLDPYIYRWRCSSSDCLSRGLFPDCSGTYGHLVSRHNFHAGSAFPIDIPHPHYTAHAHASDDLHPSSSGTSHFLPAGLTFDSTSQPFLTLRHLNHPAFEVMPARRSPLQNSSLRRFEDLSRTFPMRSTIYLWVCISACRFQLQIYQLPVGIHLRSAAPLEVRAPRQREDGPWP